MKIPENKLKDVGSSLKDSGPLLGMGAQLAASILVMVFIGWQLDKYFDTKPALTIAFSLFGVFAGLYNFIKTVLQYTNKKNEKNNNN